MKKTYILYCCIISVILMPFKWFAPENMTDSGGNWISGNKKDCQAIKTSQSFHVLIRIELTHPPPEGGALSTELQGHLLI